VTREQPNRHRRNSKPTTTGLHLKRLQKQTRMRGCQVSIRPTSAHETHIILGQVCASNIAPARGDDSPTRTTNPRTNKRAVTQEARERHLAEGSCFWCGARGHVAKNCLKKASQRAREAGESNKTRPWIMRTPNYTRAARTTTDAPCTKWNEFVGRIAAAIKA
jgi:hypothetical protein